MADVEKGMSLFLDIFRRADKNDDGALSWDEFRGFFADGVLSQEELEKLFHEIDTHDTNNIDTGELVSYFSDHLGPFRQVLEAIEDLNKAVADTLHTTAQEYPGADFTGQFLTRFLMQQTMMQLSAIQRPLDAASDAIEEQALTQRKGNEPGQKGNPPQMSLELKPSEFPATTPENGDLMSPSTVIPGRIGRRLRRGYGTQTSWEAGLNSGSTNLAQQVDRLRTLIDRFEKKVNLEGGPEEEVDIQKENLIQIVHRRLRVNPDNEKAFRNALRCYIESTNEESSCLHLTVRSFAGSHCFAIYEVWDGEDHWRSHVASTPYKNFQHANVDCLEMPEQLNTIQIPSSWWKPDENQ